MSHRLYNVRPFNIHFTEIPERDTFQLTFIYTKFYAFEVQLPSISPRNTPIISTFEPYEESKSIFFGIV